MEFFQWMSFGQIIFYAIASMTLRDPGPDREIALTRTECYVGIGVGAALFLLCLILGGFGLMKMAKGQGKKHAWVAFFPFANTIYAGVIAGEAKLFGQKMKRAGLYAAIAEIFYVAFSVISLVADLLLLPYYRALTGEYGTYIAPDPALIGSQAPQLRWLYEATYGNGWVNIVQYVLLLIFSMLFFVVLFALLKKYYSKSPAGITALAVLGFFFPIRGILIFALRNHAPVDYDALMKRRMEEYARRNPYGPYGGPTYGGPQAPGGAEPQEPFSDFGNSGGSANSGGGNDDPFSDF